jgi:hypothetical protein
MTPQERDVIAGIFDRLKQAANQPRDPEAERFIADRLAQQPYAPYAMAQAVYVQEQALLNLQKQVEDLQREVEAARAQPQPQSQPSGGFLSGLFGGGEPARPDPASPSPFPRAAPGLAGRPASAGLNAAMPSPGRSPQGGAWSGQQPAMGAQPGQQPNQPAGPWGGQRPGGGFMATALTTAAGVAGGMMLGSVLTNAFQGAKPPADQTAAAPPAGDAAASAAPNSDMAAADGQDPAAEPASYDDPGLYDDGGGFDDGGGDWA